MMSNEWCRVGSDYHRTGMTNELQARVMNGVDYVYIE